MQENKKILTIEDLKRRNSSWGCLLWVLIPGCLIGMFFGVLSLLSMPQNKFSDSDFMMVTIMFVLFPLAGIAFFLWWMKKEKKENIIIDEGNFKIVEDKIYDKHMYTTRDSDGDTHYHYRVFSKIYGEISISASEYNNAQKDDFIYLLFYNGNEKNSGYESITEEEKRNRKIIDQKYLAAIYELGSDLTPYFVPYNESLGESNFNNRIQYKINELKIRKGKVVCKHCNKKYSLEKYESCPNCGSYYTFDITDVIHEKDWC